MCHSYNVRHKHLGIVPVVEVVEIGYTRNTPLSSIKVIIVSCCQSCSLQYMRPPPTFLFTNSCNKVMCISCSKSHCCHCHNYHWASRGGKHVVGQDTVV